jgi:hypothetical protein
MAFSIHLIFRNWLQFQLFFIAKPWEFDKQQLMRLISYFVLTIAFAVIQSADLSVWRKKPPVEF